MPEWLIPTTILIATLPNTSQPGAVSVSPAWILVALAIASGLIAAGKWIGNVNSDRTSFKEFMKEIRTDIKKILGYVGPRLADNESPVVLNALGKKVSEAMGVKVWAKETAPGLLGEVAGWKEYRVYEFCTEYAKNLELTEEQEDIARTLAYEHGFQPEQVRTAYAIELRDALLADVK